MSWPSSPPLVLYKLSSTQRDITNQCKQSVRDLAGPIIEGSPNAERLTLGSILTKLGSVGHFPKEKNQIAYTDSHPLVCQMRILICGRSGVCTLCAFYEWGPIVETHKLKYCTHRAESKDVALWLEMFRYYKAKGGGPGAQCEHCRFPLVLCWRTAYREKMDAEYGNEVEAREGHDVCIRRCDILGSKQSTIYGWMLSGRWKAEWDGRK